MSCKADVGWTVTRILDIKLYWPQILHYFCKKSLTNYVGNVHCSESHKKEKLSLLMILYEIN